MLHRQVTSKARLLPTPSGTSNSHAIPVQLRIRHEITYLNLHKYRIVIDWEYEDR
jgi:hypothetical protein